MGPSLGSWVQSKLSLYPYYGTSVLDYVSIELSPNQALCLVGLEYVISSNYWTIVQLAYQTQISATAFNEVIVHSRHQ